MRHLFRRFCCTWLLLGALGSGFAQAGSDYPIYAPPTVVAFEYGVASVYAMFFHGRQTASGPKFDAFQMTAAHKSLPFGTLVRVVAVGTGKSVVVKITDRGPFVKGRVIDLSPAAARVLGVSGIARVALHLE